MKKTTLALITSLCLLITAPLVAQVQKGDKNIGINTLLSSFVGTSSPNTNGSVSLSYQYYITNNISLGIGPFYSFSSNKSEGPGFSQESWSDALGINAFANYSFLTSGGKVLPYLGLQFSYLGQFTGTDSDIQGNSSSTYTDVYNSTLGANGGLKYFITERVNLDGNLSYTSILSTTVETDGNSFDVDPEGGLLQFTIGLGVIIGKKE